MSIDIKELNDKEIENAKAYTNNIINESNKILTELDKEKPFPYYIKEKLENININLDNILKLL